MLRICKHCQSPFRTHKKVPRQQFCSSKTCQKARRQQWHQKKLQSDDDYKKNQREAQKNWGKTHPDYWRNYRKNHPLYVGRNKKLQKKRNIKSRNSLKKAQTESHIIAKMDELARRSNLISGYYMLYPVTAGKIAKMDEMLVRIDVIT
ncbi:MAG: hypothetical protein JRI61_11880 [Deltaproteobacteria bacterium]|nr:hypothetical protein [Deltaproteobacteria bacterium]